MSATALKSDRMTIDDVYRILDYTEGMQERSFLMTEDGKAGFTVDQEEMDRRGGKADVHGSEAHPYLRFHIGSDEFDISAESVVQAYKLIGLPVAYAEKTPMKMVYPHLDYWFRNKTGEQKALIKGDKVVSFCRPGTSVYSTRKLLASLLGSHILPENASVVNFYHDIYETHFAIIDETVSTKLPDGSVLSGGIMFQTSLVGLKPLQLSPFVLRSTKRVTMDKEELYEGGAMSTAIPAMSWDRTNDKRRLSLPPEEAEILGTAYEYVEETSKFLMGLLSQEFDRVKRLAKVRLDGHAGTFLDDLINKYKVPPRLYQPVMQEFQHSESSRSALELWMAFGHLALRDFELTPRLRRMVYQTAGELARHPQACDSCHRSVPDHSIAL